LKKLGNGHFCSEAHRLAFSKEQEDAALARLIEEQYPQPVKAKKAVKQEEETQPNPVVGVAGLVEFNPPPVEWSWRGLRKDEITLIPPDFGRILPRFEHKRLAALPTGGAQLRRSGSGNKRAWPAKPSFSPLEEPVFAAKAALPVCAAVTDSNYRIPTAAPVAYSPVIGPLQAKPRRSPVAAMRIPSAAFPAVLPRPRIAISANVLFSTEEPPLNLTKLYPLGTSLSGMAAISAKIMAEPLPERRELELPRPRVMTVTVAQPSLIRVTLNSLAAGEGCAFVVPPAAIPITAKALRPRTPLQLGTKVAFGGRLPVQTPIAKIAERLMATRLETVAVPSAPVHPHCVPLPVLDFNPPKALALTLSISPKSGGDPRRWARSIATGPLPERDIPLAHRKSPLSPSCDWVPRIAPPQPLAVDFAPHNVALRALGHLTALDPAELIVAISVAPLRLDGSPGLKPGRRMFPLILGSLVAGKQSEVPLGSCQPVEEQGSWVTPTSHLIPRTPELAPPEFDANGLAHVLGAKFRRLTNRIPKVPTWTVAAFAGAILAFGMLPGLISTASGVPSVAKSADVSAFSTTLASLQKNILKRAAISLTDDFRNGLSDWEGEGDWAQKWAYDASGFVRTGPLALFTPSLGLTDYRMEFLGKIDQKSMGWVVRAADRNNYQAVKLDIAYPEPVPEVMLQRWVVIGGVKGPVKQIRLPLPVRLDTMYRVSMEVKGKDFALTIQDKVIDSWSESRLSKGGIGFFSAKGERARLAWVGIWHQYDTLGRLCALIAPPVYGPSADAKE
jgi:hypothetical protein